MFKIKDKNMYLNRGDQITIELTGNQDFQVGDVIKFSVVKENDYNTVYLQKTFTVGEESDTFSITLTSDETRIGDPIKTSSKTYWYEIELNGIDTLIGYDEDGGKKFILYPEAADLRGE
jgi:hypothetical protein